MRKPAIEKSTYVQPVTFRDEYGDAVTPSAITWTLTDLNGSVINDREDVEVETPASSINIVLSGNDLAIPGSGETTERVLTVEATYTSDNGSGLPMKGNLTFTIKNLKPKVS